MTATTPCVYCGYPVAAMRIVEHVFSCPKCGGLIHPVPSDPEPPDARSVVERAEALIEGRRVAQGQNVQQQQQAAIRAAGLAAFGRQFVETLADLGNPDVMEFYPKHPRGWREWADGAIPGFAERMSDLNKEPAYPRLARLVDSKTRYINQVTSQYDDWKRENVEVIATGWLLEAGDPGGWQDSATPGTAILTDAVLVSVSPLSNMLVRGSVESSRRQFQPKDVDLLTEKLAGILGKLH